MVTYVDKCGLMKRKTMNLITGKREREISDPAHDSWRSIISALKTAILLIISPQTHTRVSFMANELDQLWNMLDSTCFNCVLLNPHKIESWSPKKPWRCTNRIVFGLHLISLQKNAIRTYHKKGALFFPHMGLSENRIPPKSHCSS